jgi:sporulation protein YlmC with PRC-barrel domain
MRLSDLLKMEVYTESGEDLGHVYDIRVERDPRSATDSAGQKWQVKGLVIGRFGFLHRFGLATATSRGPTLERDLVPWSAIVSMKDGRIVVKDSAVS